MPPSPPAGAVAQVHRDQGQVGAPLPRLGGEQRRRPVVTDVRQRHAVVFQIVNTIVGLLLLGEPAIRQCGGSGKTGRHNGGGAQQALVAGPAQKGFQQSVFVFGKAGCARGPRKGQRRRVIGGCKSSARPTAPSAAA